MRMRSRSELVNQVLRERCGSCYNFQPPNACKFIQGDVSPSGWCQLFAPKT